jgi:hypothetical protein
MMPDACTPGTGLQATAPVFRHAIGRVLEKDRLQGLPDRKAENASAFASWQGPSPLSQCPAGPWRAGAQRPRPAPDPAGASRPPGRVLASVGAGGTGPDGSVPHQRGKRMRFLFPPEEGADDLNPNRQRRCHGRGHRPCHSATLNPGPPGAKSPRPAPAPPPTGASRPPGRALASAFPGPAGLRGTVPHGRGNAVRFLIPPAPTNVPSPLHWQGPSPPP